MIVISLALRVPQPDIKDFMAATMKLIEASRAEPGVVAYSFATDWTEEGLVRVLEIFTDQAALDAHMASAHFQAWRPLSANYPREERRIMDAQLKTPR
jgi:quinol monooxygenase YgiN